jgi:IclR family transcriptional regulator, KDG regulon repressor
METEDGVQLTRSVLKALDILDFLHQRGDALPPAEIASGIGVSRPTAYRLLATMANRGWVAKDAQDPGKYHLGYHILQLAGAFLRDLDIRSVARPFMEQLSNKYDVSVRLFILDDGEAVYLDNVMGSHPFQSLIPLGKRGCLHSKAVGKAILAHLPEEQVLAIARTRGLEARTARTITDLTELTAELARVRKRGYATADREDNESLRAVGAVILNFQNAPIGGLAISDLVSRMSDDSMEVLGEALHQTAAKVSEQLGCTQYEFME